MYLRRTKYLTCLLVLVFGSFNLFSQDTQVKYLGIENGLSNNAVNTIFQDHNGFMWFGTYDGLNRYDGYDFKVFRNNIGDSTSINSNAINSIDEDKQNRLWVGGQKEVSIYDPVTAKFATPHYTFYNNAVKKNLNDNVIAVKTIEDEVLLGTQHNGLFYFDNSLNGNQVILYKNGKKIIDYYVSAIEYDRQKKIVYVSVQQQGLYVYDLRKHALHLKTDAAPNANCLKIDSRGKLWLGANNGLCYFNDSINKFSEIITPYKAPVVGISEDKKGVLWIASDGGGAWLLNVKNSIATSLSSSNKNGNSFINSNAVYAIYIDKEERKWIGTLRGGINIIEPAKTLFKTIIYQPESDSNSIQNFILSFCEDEKKNVWIGTDGAGLRYWNRADNTYRNFTNNSANNNSISSNFITGILKDGNNNIWVSTWRGGINRYNTSLNSFEHYTCYNPTTKIADNNVWFLFEDSKEKIWAGAVRNGGLYQLNTTKNKFECFDSNLPELQCMAEDAKGNLWAGNYSSLIKIDTVNKQHHYYNIGYTVRCIHEDAKENLWVGTQEGGLLLFNSVNGSFKRYTTSDGLPGNTILRMLEDKKGNLWLSSYNGLSKFDIQQKKFKNFSQADGLQSNQFSYNGAVALTTGEFLFGGIKGFNIFYPDSVTGKKRIPEIFLSAIKINNTPVQDKLSYIKERNLEQITRIVIPYNEASLSLDFLGLDYSGASDLNYAYKLNGWDKAWNFVNHTRTANYSRLLEGDYTFEVRVSNSGEVWSGPQKLLYITVLPPWYRTWWAYCLYILIGGAIIYLYILYKNRQAKLQYEVQLAHLETQKEKELNEKKIVFFTNVSHEFRTPLSLIINPIKDLLNKTEHYTEKAELKVVYRNAQRLLRLVDQLLLFKKADAETDTLHLASINFYNLCNDVFSCFTEQARSKKIKYELQCNDNPGELIINADREKVEIALFNILSNAFKYTPAGGEIIFAIEEQQTQVKVLISDNGAGISTAEGEKLFQRFYQAKADNIKSGFGIGLYLVKNFVEAHSGKVSYQSKEGKGTTFTILLPKNIAKQSQEYITQTDSESANNNHEEKVDALDNTIVETTLIELKNEKPYSTKVSPILTELNEEITQEDTPEYEPGIPQELASGKQAILIIDDDKEIRNYLVNIFAVHYKVYEADCAEDGIGLAHKHLPDLIICDIVMKALNGIDLCKQLKEDKTVSHIPIILLTGSSSNETQLQGIESGADDFIKKPFDKDILFARVASILKRHNVLQSYFYNEITLGNGKFKVSAEYKEFLEKCMKIIEEHLHDEQFSINILASEMSMSHSNMYKKIKAISGQSLNGFIRFIRLKKAAEILINTESNVSETANNVGFYDVKYFRVQFFKVFGLNPSDYIKKFRKPFHNTQTLDEKIRQ
jgi:signal transduction histidine kinase/ligand-binding sensor domain-containing protein/DNA-binding response OmpR family regulator